MSGFDGKSERNRAPGRGASGPWRLSTRFLYWGISSVMVILLVAGAFGAHRYIDSVIQANARDLRIQQGIDHQLRQVRNDLWRADTVLNTTLVKPQLDEPEAVRIHLRKASQRLARLLELDLPADSGLNRELQALSREIATLQKTIADLFEKRQRIDWIYPMLPFIDQHLRENHEQFLTAVDLAMDEIAASASGVADLRLWQAFQEIRNLWTGKVLAFRALVIRFAGLNERHYISQEKNIEILNREIARRLQALAVRLANAPDAGLQVEASLEAMRRLQARWQEHYEQFRELRETNIWRNDLHFLHTRIRPVQARISHLIHTIDDRLTAWSGRNVDRLQRAVLNLSREIWLFLLLAIGFILVIYFLVDRSTLKPIQDMIRQLSGESGELQPLDLQRRGGREIRQLVDAYNQMRREIHQRQTALEHQAMHDALTGLPNRVLLLDRLEQGMHLARRQETDLLFILMDLNRFKEINDTLGHPVGDQVLQQLGQRLTRNLRESDTVARLGGDEFAILALDLRAHEIPAFLEKIVHLVGQVITVGGQDLYVGASLGVALFPRHGEDAATLIRHADIAMYRAKRNRRNYVIYEPGLEENREDSLSLLGDLRAELDRAGKALQLHYQPQMQLADNRITSVEALLRWRHPQRGFVPPEDIVRLAEQSGLVTALTARILDMAIAECASWQERHPDLGVAVNLSAWDLQDSDLPEHVGNCLVRHGLPARCLTLEVTESVVMNDPLRARQVMQQFTEMGVSLAIDDYGTGFSSLAYLKLLPVHSLKIDRAFVMDMLEDENDAIIVRSTVDLAHNLGLKVVAEGVESALVLALLRELSCDAVQGYHLARPMARDALLRWLDETSERLRRA